MDSTKSRYTNRPHLLRVATELANYKNPGKVLNAVRSVLESSVDNPANSDQNLSLLGS